MSRHENLHTYLDSIRGRKFRPGSHDCALYVAGWVERITCVDHAKQWRGKYRSMAKGAKIMAADGYSSHVDYVAQMFEEIPPALAQVGDIAVVDDAALGIVGGDRVFVLRPDGVGHVSRLKAVRAFKV